MVRPQTDHTSQSGNADVSPPDSSAQSPVSPPSSHSNETGLPSSTLRTTQSGHTKNRRGGGRGRRGQSSSRRHSGARGRGRGVTRKVRPVTVVIDEGEGNTDDDAILLVKGSLATGGSQSSPTPTAVVAIDEDDEQAGNDRRVKQSKVSTTESKTSTKAETKMSKTKTTKTTHNIKSSKPVATGSSSTVNMMNQDVDKLDHEDLFSQIQQAPTYRPTV